MRAVWSFWSAPHRRFYHRYWHSERTHRLCWILSVAQAARHYPDTCLHADEAGAALLVDRMGLPFRHVSTALEELNRADADPEWWVLGKLATYAAQDGPFVHIDADVILWNPIPPAIAGAPVFSQNPERFEFEDQSLYRADRFVEAMTELGGWLPDEWIRYAGRRRNAALCCGIVGGSDVAFFRRYARTAMAIIAHPRNRIVWQRLGIRDNILVEQYFLAACLEAAADEAGLPPTQPRASFLFPSSAHAFDPVESGRRGYTHLIGDAKADPDIAGRLEARVRAMYPELYERCLLAGEAAPEEMEAA